jgi:hypothetical protein
MAAISLPSDGINLVDENDARRLRFPALLLVSVVPFDDDDEVP